MLLVGGGCSAHNEEPAIEHRYTVVNKAIRSNAYLLEITSPSTHEYVEVTNRIWDRTSIGDSVTLNEQGKVVAVNGEPVNEDRS